MIDLSVQSDRLERAVRRARERNILIPTFAQMKDPSRAPEGVKRELAGIGLWDVHPRNLFRISWKNEPREKRRGLRGRELPGVPPALTGVQARIIALVGKWFPTGAHKVGAAFACLVPRLVTGQFDPTSQKAVWPSTGNYCRGGAYDSALLGCQSIAILPEGMSRERFEWLSRIAGEVIRTPGSESNVKEIFDKCWELRKSGQDLMIFNQFEEAGNYLWHYEVTGHAMQEVLRAGAQGRGHLPWGGPDHRLGGHHRLRRLSETALPREPDRGQRGPAVPDPAGQRLRRAPHRGHRGQARSLDPQREEHGRGGGHRRQRRGQPGASVQREGRPGLPGRLPGSRRSWWRGWTCWAFPASPTCCPAIKYAKYFELGRRDVVLTVLTDSMQLYGSRLKEMRGQLGEYRSEDAAAHFARYLSGASTDNLLELSYQDRRRVHNLKYYTWVEQQGRSYEEIMAQWYDPQLLDRHPVPGGSGGRADRGVQPPRAGRRGAATQRRTGRAQAGRGCA